MIDRKSGEKRRGRARATRKAAPVDSGDELLQMLSYAVQQSPNEVVITNASGEIEYVNPSFAGKGGFASEEIIGKHVRDIGELSPEEQSRLWKTLQTEGEWRGEFRVRTKAGDVYWMDSSIFAIRSSTGEVAHYLGLGRDITQRKSAEDALRESEERFRSAFDHAAIGMAIVAPDGRLLRVNRPCYQALGLTESELTSMNWRDVTHPEDIAATEDQLKRLLSGDAGSLDMEKRFLHKHGDVLWGYLSSSLIRDSEGRPAYFITQIQDITERKRAEEALRRSEERHRELVESINESIYELDTALRITYISPVAEELGDYHMTELVGRLVADLVHPEDRERLQEYLVRAMAGEVEPVEFRVITKSGGSRWHRSVARKAERDGRVIGLRGVLTDIAESKRAEEALRESEERYRTFYEHNPSMYFTVDAEGAVLSVNRFGADQLGYEVEELAGRPVQEVFQEGDRAAVAEQLATCIQNMGEVAEWEFRKVRKNGDVILVKEAARAVRGPDGETIVLIVCEDITERRRAEEALQEAREELESVVESQMRRGNAYGLTFRELTVLHLVAAGKSDRDVGTILGISPRTANKHVENILAKMRSSSRTEAGVRAVREGLLD